MRRLLLTAFLGAPLVLSTSLHADPAQDLVRGRNLQARKLWAASDSLAAAALAGLEKDPTPDSLVIAEALYLIGNARYRAAGYTDSAGSTSATRSLGIRLRRLGADDLGVAEAHALVGTYLAGTDHADSALVHVRRALDIRIARLAPGDTLLADNWDQLALIFRDKRDFHSAIGAWDKAIEIRNRHHGGENVEAALFLAQAGICWSELSDLDRAREVLHSSLEVFARTNPDHPRRWVPLNNLATVEQRAGNQALCIDLTQEALRVARRSEASNPRPVLTLRHNLAGNFLKLGESATARAIWADLLPRHQVQFGSNHWRTLAVLQCLASTSAALGDTAGAMRLLKETERLFVARGGVPNRFESQGLVVQGVILFDQGRYREAVAMSRRSLRTAVSMPRPEPVMVIEPLSLGVRALEALGDTAALDSLRVEGKRLTEQYTPGPSETRARFLHACARAARGCGLRDESWDLAVQAERTSREFVRLNIQTLPDRRALGFMRSEEAYLNLVIDMARGGPADRYEIAWDDLVRSRGMVRAEIVRRRPPGELISDTLVVGLHGRWVDWQRRLAQKLVSTPVPDSAARLALEQLRDSRDEAEAAYVRALESRAAMAPLPDVDLADVRSELLPGRALVSLFEVEGAGYYHVWNPERDSSRVIAFIARGGEERIDCVELARSTLLLDAIEPWRECLSTSPGKEIPPDRAEHECRRLGREVRALTWDRLAPHLGGIDDVYFVCDGPLIDLPWQALPVGERDYLVEAGPRLHVLSAERELIEAPVATAGSLLAVGAPDFDHSAVQSDDPKAVAAFVRSAMGPCVNERPPVFGPLPESGLEVEAVARYWRADPDHEATILKAAEATEQAFKRAARGRSIIHLATHGVVAQDTCSAGNTALRGVGGIGPVPDTAAPKSSLPSSRPPASHPSPWMGRRVWLALAGANQSREHHQDENEGLLTAEEVLMLDLEGTDWVVLSACHSGVAEGWSRDGALGMRRAFNLAGVRTVIASHWALEDRAAREWMSAFYRARAQGLRGAAKAVESACRAVLGARRADGLSSHPFYWAAFSAVGE